MAKPAGALVERKGPPTRWRISERSGGSAFARNECFARSWRSQPKLSSSVRSAYALEDFRALRRISLGKNPVLLAKTALARVERKGPPTRWRDFRALRRISLRENSERRLVSRVGIEPTTRRLRVCCSAN